MIKMFKVPNKSESQVEETVDNAMKTFHGVQNKRYTTNKVDIEAEVDYVFKEEFMKLEKHKERN